MFVLKKKRLTEMSGVFHKHQEEEKNDKFNVCKINKQQHIDQLSLPQRGDLDAKQD